jgi:DNA-binding NarL/FixJ family response regulator
MGGSSTRRVLIASEHRVLRLGMRTALERGGLEVVAEADTARGAAAAAVAHAPDLCLIDAGVRGGGLEATGHVVRGLSATAVLVVTEVPDETELLAALRAGAAGYMPRAMDAPQLASVAHAVLAGAAVIPRTMVAALAEDLYERDRRRQQEAEQRLAVRLTAREWDVMDLLRAGHSTAQVAAKLGISTVTVRRHASDVARKLDVPTRQMVVDLLRDARI